MSQADYSTRDGIAVITMSNPPVNGLGHALRTGIVEAVRRAEADPEIVAIVLTGAWDAIVDRYFPVVDALECELEAIEASMFSNNQAKENIRKLYQLKRKVETLRHAVLPFSEAVGKLFGGEIRLHVSAPSARG